MTGGSSRFEIELLREVSKITNALNGIERHLARYMNDDTTLLDRLCVAEEENRLRIDALEAASNVAPDCQAVDPNPST